MPIYVFLCDNEDGGCGHGFEEVASMSEISDLKPKCPECSKSKPVRRDYKNQGSPSTFQTLGMWAEKNTKGMTEQQKKSITDNNRNKPEWQGPLPQGARTLTKDENGKWIPD